MIFNNTLMTVFVWMLCLVPCLCSVQDKKLEACYGDGWRLLPTCGSDEVVYPYQIYLAAKDPNICPAILHKNETNSTLTDLCCRINQTNACGGLVNITYYRTYKEYFGNCIGRDQCTDVPIEQTQSSDFNTCSPQFHENTTLVTIIYQCVKDVENIFYTKIITNHSEIHLKGQEYGNPILRRKSNCNNADDNADDVIQCSVEAASCNDKIDVLAWDLRLECGQEIWFCDSNETVKLTCNNNTGIQKIEAYQSLSNYVILTIKNSLSRDGGYFWLASNPVPLNSTLTVSCPAKRPRCPLSSSCQKPQGRTCLSVDTTDDYTLYIIAGVIGCVILLIIIVVVILIVIKWKHRKKIEPNAKMENNRQIPNEERNKHEYMARSQTASHNHLPPIFPNNQQLEKEEIKKLKKEKKKKKKNRRKEEEIENNIDRDLNVTSISREVTEISEGRKRKKKKKNKRKEEGVQNNIVGDLNVTSTKSEGIEVSEGRKKKKSKKKKSRENKEISKDNNSMDD